MLDIILPTIGRPGLIAAINSVIAQTYQHWRLFVVFDVARMSAEEEIKRWIKNKKDSRIHILRYTGDLDNYCGTQSRNMAIRASSASTGRLRPVWIAYLDDDCEYRPNHLEEMANLIKSGRHDMLHVRGAAIKYGHKHPRSSERVKKIVGYTDDPTCVGMAHTRSIFAKTSGWQPIPEKHDWILWEEMLAAGGRPGFSEVVTYEFNIGKNK